MEWIRNKTAYHSVEEAILAMSGQSAEELLSPSEVPAEQVCGIKQAGETIEECIRKNMPVVIVGDYDADGITSTTILTRLLYSMGVKVRPIIPADLRTDTAYPIRFWKASKKALSSR